MQIHIKFIKNSSGTFGLHYLYVKKSYPSILAQTYPTIFSYNFVDLFCKYLFVKVFLIGEEHVVFGQGL